MVWLKEMKYEIVRCEVVRSLKLEVSSQYPVNSYKYSISNTQ